MDSNDSNVANESVGVATAAGQWRLARVELFNWGTFDRYHAFDVSRDGVLLTGASGSGKSTIVDAISTVMSPSAKMGYNAAASNGTKRDRGRNYNNYVRGAWGHASDAEGETTRMFLRPREATWSGILLRFEDGCDTVNMGPSEAARHEAVNLLAVFFQKRNAVSDDALKSFYAVVRGSCTLADVEEYGRGGADLPGFNKAFKGRGGQAWSSQKHAQFLARACALLRISGPQTLTLLQKTQAAKNIGSLDDLFRRYMLDQPQTFKQADAAVEQFEELENAHRGVVRQREQMEMLAPLDEYDRAYAEQQAVEAEAAALKDVSAAFAEALIVDVIDDALARRVEERAVLEEAQAECQASFTRAKQAHETAAAILNDIGGVALSTAEMDVMQREKELRNVLDGCALLNRALANVGLGNVPPTLHEYEALKATVQALAHDEGEWARSHEEEKVRIYGDLDSLGKRIKDIDSELRHLRASRSNIPRALHEIREDIASAVGLTIADVPFVGELIDVKPEEAGWQGAIERLLRGRAQTMLIDKRYAPAVSEYLEGRHLGLRFEYDAVPDQVEVPAKTLHAKSLVRKVDVEVREGHENLTRWVNRLLRTSFDYICVDTPSDLARHSHALTRAGQVKAGEHHVKDDRTRVGDRSHWVLGSTNDSKIAQLENDRSELASRLDVARAGTRQFDERLQRKLLLERLVEELDAKDWADLDLAAAESALESARVFHASLLENDDFKHAQQQRDRAYEAMQAADSELRDVRVRLERSCADARQLDEKRERHLARRDALSQSSGYPGDAQAIQLRNLFKHADKGYLESVERVYQAKDGAVAELDRRLDRSRRAQQDAKSRSEVIMQKYKDAFKAESANLTVDFRDRDGFIARYRQIKSTGLARYESKFLEVLTNFSQDQITVIATEIRNAFRDVRDRLEPVNRSLMLSPYAPGVHLQIEVREARSARVEKFLADLREITSGSWEVGDIASAEERYERTAAVMRRLKSSERADREWRRECLNTPDHMKFIAKEIDQDGDAVNVHSNDEGLSGGQKQKLVFFCLAAALRYQLSEGDAQVPSYGTIVLDETFDKSDRHFAEEALNIFKAFNFHMVLATPGKLLQTIEGHVGGVVLVTCEDGKRSRLSPISFEEA